MKSHRWFLLLACCYLAARLIQAVTATHSYDDEDGFVITAAWELLNGGAWPYQAYQLTDWENGTLVAALLAVPFCWLLGPSLLALKLTGLVCSTVTLAGLYLLGCELSGRRAGLLACLLFFLFPGPLFHYSLTAHGFHPDSMALQLLFLWRLMAALRRGLGPRQLVLAGALGGLSVYYAYISAITVAAALAVAGWSVCRRHGPGPGLRRLGALGGGLLLGATPLVMFNLMNQARGVRIYHGRPLLSYVAPGDLAAKLSHFGEHTLDALVYFSNHHGQRDWAHTVYNLCFWAVGLCAVLYPLARVALGRLRGSATAQRGPRPALEPLVLLVLLGTLFVFFASRHPIYPWHLAPVLTLLLLPLAARIDGLWRWTARPGMALAVALLGGLCLPGLALNLTQIHPRALGLSASLDARNYPMFYGRLAEVEQQLGRYQRRQDHRRWLALPLERIKLERWSSDYPHWYHGHLFTFDRLGLLSQKDLQRLLDQGQQLAPRAQRGLVAGYALARQAEHPAPGSRPALEQIRAFPMPLAGQLMEGFAFGLTRRQAGRMARQLSAPRLARRMALGHGRALRVPTLLGGPAGFCADFLPARLRTAYASGAGYGMACRFLGPVPRAVTEHFCEQLRAPFLHGVKRSKGRCPVQLRAGARP